jgi:hypothetical protein
VNVYGTPQETARAFLLERFFEASGLAAQIVKEHEEPDFLIRFEKRLIGIEVTQFFISTMPTGRFRKRKSRSPTRSFTEHAQLYEAAGAPPAHVSVCFASGHELR